MDCHHNKLCERNLKITEVHKAKQSQSLIHIQFTRIDIVGIVIGMSWFYKSKQDLLR